MTRWGLDTCKCVLEFSDGDHVVETSKFLTRCQDHQQDTLLTVIEENRGKNRVMAKFLEQGMNPDEVRFEFEKKGGGRRLCKIIIPAGSPTVEIDEIDVKNTRIFRK